MSDFQARRLGIGERLDLERKIRWAAGWYVLLLGAALVDWVLGSFGRGWPTVLGLQGPMLLRRIGFSIVLKGIGGVSIPLGPVCALLMCCVWAWVGYWFVKGVRGAFVFAVAALGADSLAYFAGIAIGRNLGLAASSVFIVLRMIVLGSWISVWRRLVDLEKQGYSVARSA